MLTTAFANEIVQRIENVALRSWVDQLVTQRLNSATPLGAGLAATVEEVAS